MGSIEADARGAGLPLPRDSRRTVSGLTRRRRRVGTLIVLPAFAVVVGVLWVPVCQAVYYGFTDWNGVTAHWIGLANYRSFVDSPAFRQVIFNNLLLLTALPALVLGPLVIAFVLSRAGRAKSFFRVALFMPVPLSWAVVGAAGIYVFARGGPVNSILRTAGLGALATDWLGHDASARTALLLLIVWALFGTNLIIYQSAVSSFDETLVDAAKVDGAGPVRTFVHIVVPVLSPFVRFVTIYTVTLLYAYLFTMIFVFSAGGPGFSTTTLEFFTYYQGFNAGQYAAAAASGSLLFMVVFLVNLPQLGRFLQSR
jgi:ABC-type sugar transport system permease subunit